MAAVRSAFEMLGPLTSDLGDQVEVLGLVQDGEAGGLGGRCDEQIRYRGCPMMATVGEEGENLDGTILGRRGGVFDRHGGNRRLMQPGVEIPRVPCRVADLEQRHRRDTDQPTLDRQSRSNAARIASLSVCS
jgi:hypothetical protein